MFILIWGGVVVLLVGVGLGFQEMFKDLFFGVILLFECWVEVGDVVEVDGFIGMVKWIGVWILLVEICDNIVVIVFNFCLIVQYFVNWSYNDNKACFYIKVGVAYGLDMEFVKQLLLDIVWSNVEVICYLVFFVCFVDFGDFFFDFEFYFWLYEFI